MTKQRTLNPTVDTMVSTAIERRKAGKPPASLVVEAEEAELEEKAEPAPANKAARKPANKGKK